LTAPPGQGKGAGRLLAVPWLVLVFCWPATLLAWYYITLVADPSWWRDRFLFYYLVAMLAVDSAVCVAALALWTRHARALRRRAWPVDLAAARRAWRELLNLPVRTAALLLGLIGLTLVPGTVILLARGSVGLVLLGYTGAAMAAACELTVLLPVVQGCAIPLLRRLKDAHPELRLRAPGVRAPPLHGYFAFGLAALCTVSLALVVTLMRLRARGGPPPVFPEGPAIALAIVCVVCMGAGIALQLYAAVLVPLGRLAAAMQRFSAEEKGVRVGLLHVGELGLVCEHFDDMAAALEQSRARLEEREALLRHAQRFEVMGTVTATFAHEVANPLTCAASNLEVAQATVTELLRASLPLPPAAAAGLQSCAEALADADAATRQMRLLLGDMRSFARREAGAAAACDLAALMDGALRLASGELRGRRAEVTRDYQPCPAVNGSPHKLSQVLLNLLLNAAQALSPGRPGQIKVGVRRRGGEIEVSVGDNGQGIALEHRPRLFEALFTTKPDGQGTGLGLHVSQKIVAEHGGRIELDSQPGAGTVFRVLLPAPDGDSPAREASAGVR